MRDAFFSELEDAFREDERLVFITGDLGYKLFDGLTKIDAARVINFGLREAAMIGYAAGLAKTGFLPIVYSITPFVTLRCLEQIKLDLCYNEAAVLLVGVGGGYAYGPNGPTHFGIDDIAVLSSCPGLRIWTPADPRDVRACVQKISGLEGPSYLRLGRNGEPVLKRLAEGRPAVEAPTIMREGPDGALVSMGTVLHETLEAAQRLEQSGIRPSVVHLPQFRPFPSQAMAELLEALACVMTVEEHISIGGLGAEVAAMKAARRSNFLLSTLSAPLAFPETCVSRAGALVWAGLDAKTIARRYEALFKETGLP